MPGIEHEAVVEILHRDPQIAAMLLGRAGVKLPSGAHAVAADSNLSAREPSTLISDNVLVFEGMDRVQRPGAARLRRHSPGVRAYQNGGAGQRPDDKDGSSRLRPDAACERTRQAPWAGRRHLRASAIADGPAELRPGYTRLGTISLTASSTKAVLRALPKARGA
jgi:hypothetical protein